jgi:hypothetical protein
MRWVLIGLVVLVLAGAAVFLVGRGNPPPPATPVASPTEPVKPSAPVLDMSRIIKKAKNTWLVPQPSEIQNALKELGVSEDVSAMVKAREPDFAPMDGQRIAVNTGVVIADLVLTVNQATPQVNAKSIRTIARGLKELGAPDKQLNKLEQFAKRVESGTVAGRALVSELDEYQTAVLQGLEEFSSKDAVVGIQAGAWLRAVHLVASALQKGNKADQGGHLFQQPQVVDHFMGYLAGDAAKDSSLVQEAVPVLRQLKAIATKPEVTAQDVNQIASVTGDLLTRI